ncbi:MAG: hypothetical protein JWM33_3825 [Caulobacteraceae bacterium]|nr:hypothetical protein [Caulobacteraceae bacterium]
MSGALPSIINPTPPGGQLYASESALPQGSAPGQAALSSSWTFTIQAQDGVDSLTVGGYRAISAGVFTAGYADLGYGRLAVTGYDPASGHVSVDFTLTGATHSSSPGPTMRYGDLYFQPVVLTDMDGDQATSSLIIDVRDDDRVQAVSDLASVSQGTPIASGNVTANDIFSADGLGAVTQVQSMETGQYGGVPDGGALTLQGRYGTLTLAASGAYSYTGASQAPAGATDHFSYWVTDADGDQSLATLTVSVAATASSPSSGQTLTGGGGDDTLMGASGDDTISGGDGRNYLRGGGGDDQLRGGAGFDDINGNMGDDTIDGGTAGGGDWLVGGQGNDLVTAHQGDGLLYGNLGDDTLIGGAGSEIIRGGQGDDSLSGGAGADFISGDRGNDTMTGGSGADAFHSAIRAGIDKVTDFHQSEGDYVLLDAGTTYAAAQVGADTVVTLGSAGSGDQVILVGVSMSSLTDNWIVVAV